MSTYEHDLLTTRFAVLAPQPLPGDWDDVLDRAGAVRLRRRRLPQSLWRAGRHRKLVVALAVAVLVAAVAAAAYGTVRVLFLDRGFVGLPPVGATPSSPESGELVAHLFGVSANLPGRPLMGGGWSGPFVRGWVYADGRVIWDRRHPGLRTSAQAPEGANELNSGYLEQRLTPEGVGLVRSAVAELVDRSRAFLEPIPSVDDAWWSGQAWHQALFVPNDYGSDSGVMVVPDGDGLARLRWQDIEFRKDSRLEGPLADPEQLAALRRVDALLADPASVVPSDAWAEREVKAYVPSHYAVCILTSPPTHVSSLLSLLPAKAEELLRDKSWTESESGMLTYCSKLATEAARELAEALSGLDPEPGWRSYVLAYRVAEGVNPLFPTIIWFEPYLPHGQAAFSRPFG